MLLKLVGGVGAAVCKGDSVRYPRATKATGFSKRGALDTALRALLFFIPRTNPDYDQRLQEVTAWLVEFDDDGLPVREIGLDGAGCPVVCGPNERNYGTSMRFDDVTGDEIRHHEFERAWAKAQRVHALSRPNRRRR